MQKEYTPIGWQFWLQWMGATSVSWIAGAVLSHTLDLGMPGGLGGVVGETAWGLLLGIGQWLVLHRRLDRAGWWVLVTAAGWRLAASAGVVLKRALGQNVGEVLYAIVLGLIPGLLQGWLLRSQMGRARWWVRVSTVLFFGPLMGEAAALSSMGLRQGGVGFGAVAAITGGVVFGITSGLVLVWLLRQPTVAPTQGHLEAPVVSTKVLR